MHGVQSAKRTRRSEPPRTQLAAYLMRSRATLLHRSEICLVNPAWAPGFAMFEKWDFTFTELPFLIPTDWVRRRLAMVDSDSAHAHRHRRRRYRRTRHSRPRHRPATQEAVRRRG